MLQAPQCGLWTATVLLGNIFRKSRSRSTHREAAEGAQGKSPLDLGQITVLQLRPCFPPGNLDQISFRYPGGIKGAPRPRPFAFRASACWDFQYEAFQ